MNADGMPVEAADWVLSNVLPALYRSPEGAEELRTCICQATPSDWLGGIEEPAARFWDRDGRSLAWGAAGATTKFLGARHLVVVWEADRVCRRLRPAAASS
ncbi:hypothetical protein [Streptomyces sp. NPDC053367]|uniref:hypothetical protein n=1 Tax=Streptomyces sp. NPDC053367 TaxID=3365700 RepID=UPI0037D7F541